MKYISTSEASRKWNISQRRVRILCQNGQIPDCIYVGKSWQIPEDAEKPVDKRTTSGKEQLKHIDYLYLMLNATYADNNPNANSDEITLCNIQKVMLEGKIDEAYTLVKEYIKSCDNDGYLLVAVAIQFTLAFYLGKTVKQAELFLKYNWLLNDSRMYHMNMYLNLSLNKKIDLKPESPIPSNMLPQLMYKLRRNLILDLLNTGTKINSDYLEAESNYLNDSESEEIVAYNHILLATYYNFFNNKKLHDFHVNKALDIIIKNKWYLMIAEHCFSINWHLEKFLSEDELKIVHDLEKTLSKNFVKRGATGRIVKESKLDSILLIKVAYQIASNKTNEEMADNLQITLYQVKKLVNEIYRIIGTDDRKEIGKLFIKEMARI